ncbi:MAG: methyltransferase domain-containing protein [Candidatus Omnitrophica bacterium]|nr:methyltransferase domain-containing protein [Candidatus Omnitrophota bacterium]
MNLHPPRGNLPEYIKWVTSDARHLPLDDSSFDIAFCNSLIEHLGDWESQLKAANEIKRVAPNYFVETPDKRFPIDPHLFTPFVHWFPKSVQRLIIRNFTTWGLVTRPTSEQIQSLLNEVRFLNKKGMAKLFPDADILTERFLGFPKSLIAIRKGV